MKRVILCPNPYRDKGLSAAKEADEILRQMGMETVFCLPFKPEGGEQQYGGEKENVPLSRRFLQRFIPLLHPMPPPPHPPRHPHSGSPVPQREGGLLPCRRQIPA